MNNPFIYNKIVTGIHFCDRSEELKRLIKACENGESLYILSKRRVGKSSIIKKLFDTLDKKKYHCVSVDLWTTSDSTEFIEAFSKSITNSINTGSVEKAVKWAIKTLSFMNVSLEVDPVTNGAKINLSLNATGKQFLNENLERLFNVLRAEVGDKQLVVAFDEFQQISNYKDDQVEIKLRSIIQNLSDATVFYLGSQETSLREIFTDDKRPFHKSALPYQIENISFENWRPFVQRHFKKGDKKISDEMVSKIIEATEGQPFHTQIMCNALYGSINPGGEVAKKDVDEAFLELIKLNEIHYKERWGKLSVNAKLMLKGLSKKSPHSPMSHQFVSENRLKTASNARSALSQLERDGLVERLEGGYDITDKIFKLWIDNIPH